MTWTDAKNDRRCDLIDLEVNGTISDAEQGELAVLQDEMLAHRRDVAPLRPAMSEAMLRDFARLVGRAARVVAHWESCSHAAMNTSIGELRDTLEQFTKGD
jgi:hypothetical protein